MVVLHVAGASNHLESVSYTDGDGTGKGLVTQYTPKYNLEKNIMM